MAEKFLTLSPKDRLEALGVAATKSGRPVHLLEKDIWVVWAIDGLFSSEFGKHLVFKGGTSLSKAYGVIGRFSEDIDVTYDARELIPELVGDGASIPKTNSQAHKWRAAIEAVHVLVPQVERLLRAVVGKLGRPVTKPHPTVADVSLAIGMAESFYTPEVIEALGPDLTLYFRTLYADPRGRNLPNRVAHGLLNPVSVTEDLTHLMIHTLLVFAVWKELAEKRR